MMNPTTHCVLFYLLFGDLIVGVNHERENASFFRNRIFNRKILSFPARKILDFHLRTSQDVQNSTVGTKAMDLKSKHRHSNLSTLRPLCSPFDSCASRCAETSRGFPYICNCDSQCATYSDCCVDFERECANETSLQKRGKASDATLIANLTCELLLESYPVLMISNCSQQWENASFERLCSTQLSNECVLSSISSNGEFNDTYVRCENFVYSQCEEQLSSKCDKTLEPKCAKIVKDKCSKLSSTRCRSCMKAFWPVVDPNGILYKNSYCAMCNFQDNYTIPYLQLSETETHASNLWNTTAHINKHLRSCFPSVIDFCPKPENDDLSALCKGTSGPVTRSGKYEYRDVVYKNIYCALCHNESIRELECAFLLTNSSEGPTIMQGLIKPLIMDFVTGVTADIQGLRLDDIPAAFSMLLNFGLDGRQRVYISSEGDEAMKEHQRRCGAGYIWDPFIGVCRKLHCSTEFVLVDYQCVRKENHEEENTTDDDSILVPDAYADFVHLSFDVEMELWDFLQFNDQDIDTILESIRESFSSSFNIKIDRIRNVNFNISLGDFKSLDEVVDFIKIMDDDHPINFTISLDLYETSINSTDPEPSVDSIVSLLASALSVNGFEFGLSNKTGRIYQIHQSVDFLTSWCNSKDGGEKKEYWNSEFRLVLNENLTSNAGAIIKGIYINKTNTFYRKGQFVADILYQGFQFNQNLINVSGVAIVCDWKTKLNESCPRIILEKHEYSISENGSLLILNASLSGKVVDDTIFEEAANESIIVCLLKGAPNNMNEDYYLEMDIVQAYVSYVLSCISVSAMVIVLITYTMFSSLRNLPGCNTMNLTFSLMAMQITFLLGQRSTVVGTSCKVVACVLHYEILSCFMWMNVMAYDLYKTFGNKTILNCIRSKGKYLPRYMAYAYGSPVLIVTVTSLLDYFLGHSVFSPHYGKNNVCWITSKYAAVVYFATPLALVMSVNFGFFVLTIYSIRNVKHVLYLSNQKTNQRGKSDVFLYARMALVIGLTWALAFAAAYTKEERLTGQILTYLFIIFNTLQGVFIFCVFVCNRRVYGLYREAVQKLLANVPVSPGVFKNSRTLTRISNVMHRTVSSETVVSTISNSSTCSDDSGLKPIKEFE